MGISPSGPSSRPANLDIPIIDGWDIWGDEDIEYLPDKSFFQGVTEKMGYYDTKTVEAITQAYVNLCCI